MDEIFAYLTVGTQLCFTALTFIFLNFETSSYLAVLMSALVTFITSLAYIFSFTIKWRRFSVTKFERQIVKTSFFVIPLSVLIMSSVFILGTLG
jgi:hypothetical protein